MLLIISHEDDLSTSQVISWLNYYNVKYFRLNKEESYKVSQLEISNKGVKIVLTSKLDSTRIIDFETIRAAWYRRGDLKFFNELTIDFWDKSLNAYFKIEYEILKNFIFKYIEDLPRLDNYFGASLNKLEVLYVAKKLGLNIPKTIIFENKDSLNLNINEKFITKPISEGYLYINDDYSTYSMYTAGFDNHHRIKNEQYIASLIQNEIDKEADIRVFYFNKEVYAMAIMSQANKQT
ncbi:MAG: grasp-with-spasm system ATP-grasp peptide maturase [Bacteroidota bacterium]|jgi:hypothetical protein